MRPYQIYATEALIRHALDTGKNGYIWHTTGSGKTLTSWKCANLLSKEQNIKKVFFLIDRKDLDTQTKEEFNKLTEQDAYLIFVTNEIGLGGVSPDAVQRRFTDLQGWLNQYIASRADEVVFMVSGIPMKVK